MRGGRWVQQQFLIALSVGCASLVADCQLQTSRENNMSQRQQGTRATTIEEFIEIQSKMMTPEEVGKGLEFQPGPTDVIITPFAKSGTTWLQQMVHCLRTRGDMDFDDISRVVPWIEPSAALGLDLDAPQKAELRAFKSHLNADIVPKGARYICSIRDPKDVVYSFYKFMEGWFIEPGMVSVDDLARVRFIERPDCWTHLLSWWRRRDDPDVLFLVYEHMREDLEGTIKQVAKFIGVTLDEELLAITLDHTSLDFMKEHTDRYDDLLMRELAHARAGLPLISESSKVRTGNVGEHKQALSADLEAALDAIWQREITPETGFADYASLIASLK